MTVLHLRAPWRAVLAPARAGDDVAPGPILRAALRAKHDGLVALVDARSALAATGAVRFPPALARRRRRGMAALAARFPGVLPSLARATTLHDDARRCRDDARVPGRLVVDLAVHAALFELLALRRAFRRRGPHTDGARVADLVRESRWPEALLVAPDEDGARRLLAAAFGAASLPFAARAIVDELVSSSEVAAPGRETAQAC